MPASCHKGWLLAPALLACALLLAGAPLLACASLLACAPLLACASPLSSFAFLLRAAWSLLPPLASVGLPEKNCLWDAQSSFSSAQCALQHWRQR